MSHILDVETVYQHVKKDAPKPLSPLDIRRLLYEHGRNELNTRLGICIDIVAKWNGVLKQIDKRFSLNASQMRHTTIADEEDLTQNPYSHLKQSVYDMELYLEIKRLLFATKHQIHILEMIVQTQQSLRKQR